VGEEGTSGQVRRITWPQHAFILAFVAAGVAVALADHRGGARAAAEPALAARAEDEAEDAASALAIPPLPRAVAVDERKVRLGERLYHDVRLSRDDTVSCATCHDLARGGTDQLPVSRGVGGVLGPINSPTVFNSGFLFAQFWDGRAKDLVEQAGGPVHNPKEMGSTWPQVIGKLSADRGYVEAFAAIYPRGIAGETISDAIAEFEKSLVTPDSRFDRFLRGDAQALSADEKEGYRLFKEYGCVSCHQGVAVGGNMYQTLGTMEDYFAGRAETEADHGRFNVTGLPWDLHQFKVPSLRNVERSFPYLHDGSAKTLEDVLEVMWRNQLGRPLRPDESKRIVAFLKTLSGTYRGKPL
jgi:cytochrome c peroxidase